MAVESGEEDRKRHGMDLPSVPGSIDPSGVVPPDAALRDITSSLKLQVNY